MARTLIVGPQAANYADLLSGQELPGIELLSAVDPDLAAEACTEAEVLFGPPDKLAELLPGCGAVRWVQSSWAGVRPLLEQPRRDFLLTGVKDIFGEPMSEFVLGWLLALERRIIQRAVDSRWDEGPDGTLTGKALGVMGTGSIGSHVARSSKPFGLEVRGYSRSGADSAGFDTCYGEAELPEFASGLNYLVVLLPDTPSSTDLVDGELLSMLAPGAVIINAGRGNCLVEADLLAALEGGQLRAAVLDVFREEPLPATHPFWSNPRVYITSHTAAPTRAEAVVALFAENYRRYVRGEALNYRIDFKQGY